MTPTKEAAPKCPDCGKSLARVRQEPNSPLNHDQWKSTIAGDWVCIEHNNFRGNKPYAYYWNREVIVACKCCEKCSCAGNNRAVCKNYPEFRPDYCQFEITQTLIEILCEGCGDFPVNSKSPYCEECTAIIREDSLHEDPAKSHGRGGQ